jgi:hypothetical protein
MGFVTDLVVRQTGDDDWRLTEALIYEGNQQRFTVPADADTDFASVPQPFRWLIPKSGRHSKAAVLHDYLWRVQPPICSYAEADGLFRRALHDLEVPLLRRWLMWAAVRWVSSARTKFADGPGDLLRVILVTLFPGMFVIAVGAAVLVFLLTFAGFEWVGLGLTHLVRALGRDRTPRKQLKLPRTPAVISNAVRKHRGRKPPPPYVPPQSRTTVPSPLAPPHELPHGGVSHG